MERPRKFRNNVFNLSSPAATRVAAFLCVLSVAVGLPQVAQAQSYRVLHYFSSGSDGSEPWGGLIADAAGNLYGVAESGGDHRYCRGFGCGTVFELTQTASGWAFTTLYEFQGGIDGAGPQANLVIGPDGTLYGTTAGGGGLGCYDYIYAYGGCGTVFNLRPSDPNCQPGNCSWVETVLFRFGNLLEQGANPGSPVAFDRAGNIYGTTGNGGSSDLGLVYELTLSGGVWRESVIHNFTGPPDGTTPYGGVLFDSAGNLYGTAQGYEGQGGIVYELTPSPSGWTEAILHTFSDNDGWDPIVGLITDSAGNLYGGTWGYEWNGVVYELVRDDDWSFHVLYRLPGQGDGPSTHLTFDAAGNLYGATPNSVFRLTPQPGGIWSYRQLHRFGSRGTGLDQGEMPETSLVVDQSGNIYGAAALGGNDNYGTVWEITP